MPASEHVILSCLLGGAIGDALGAEIEFWSLSQIRDHFPDGVQNLPPHDGMVGAITDDTQMTLFTAEGLIRAAVRHEMRGICHPAGVIHHALLRWLVTQGEAPGVDVDDAGLVLDRRLHARRAPGNTCLSALGAARQFGVAARNGSKGCGTIMRVAPTAFAASEQVRDLAMETSALTHGHLTGQEAAAAWALILADLAQGVDLEVAARRQEGAFGPETTRALVAARTAPRDARAETVETLGGGWVAEEALAIALYACLCACDFQNGLQIAVTHGGDSDSTGAIAGNGLGLLFPEQVQNHPWASQVECRDLISDISRDLALAMSGRAAELAERYPGH
ncbi:ADP-ribosylglycohydrolase [Paracoccus isoporae]|uniref:ADP-ribosylglycohydrolase n=1 Tax=Paracoccus isoporae TaxID=591205 RepID=A0A1G6X3R1_9RHOB|nr:ADP-ribosylglycohydrolase family protein [Paracoccus isoporae]SDD72820.1 ADP-ribosylglycohydrolase [Paracoccus isoporae]